MSLTDSNQLTDYEKHSSQSGNNNQLALSVLTSIFFIWGFITCLNDILIPHLKLQFDLTYAEAMLIQFCFFGAYFICSIPAGKLVSKIGYKNGIILGLGITAFGAALFYPAAETAIYVFFLLALFVLASGITLLQVSANPYVVALGSEKTAATRLNLTQAFNSLGTTVAPLFGGLLIFGLAANASADEHAQAVQIPYVGIALFLLLLAIVVKKIRLPEISSQQEDSTPFTLHELKVHRHLLFGIVAIFTYVGGEVAIGSFLVSYFADPTVGNMTEETASGFVAWYWGGAMLGRFLGSYIMLHIPANRLLAFNAITAIGCILLSISTQGQLAVYSILLVGFFNSIMFPTIFSLALRGMGKYSSQASGLLCLAIVGGAIIPMIQGVLADSATLHISFLVPVACYIYIFWFGISGCKK